MVWNFGLFLLYLHAIGLLSALDDMTQYHKAKLIADAQKSTESDTESQGDEKTEGRRQGWKKSVYS